jgi:OFA family oxalate/formate antiporter-like MFS transporter
MGFFTGVSLIISSQIHSVWWLYLTYSFIMAMGTGEAYTVVVGFVSRWFQRKRGLALGISTTGGGIGSLIFAPFASYLIVSFDWRIGYIVMGIIALVIVISAAMLLKGYPREMGLLPDGIAADTNAKAVGARKEVKTRGFSLKEAIKTRQFWLMFMIWAFHAIAVYVITTHIVPYATDVGISHIAAATVISVMSVFNIVGGLTAGALSDAFGRKPVSIVSALLGAGSLFWLMWMPTDIWVLFVIAALFGIPFGSIATIVSAMAADIFGTYRIGAIMGVIGIAWFVGATIGPIIGGVIFDINQSYFLAFLVAAICMLIIILFLFMLSKPDSSTSSESNAENK